MEFLGILKFIKEPVFILMALMILVLFWIVRFLLKDGRNAIAGLATEVKKNGEVNKSLTRFIEGLIAAGQGVSRHDR